MEFITLAVALKYGAPILMIVLVVLMVYVIMSIREVKNTVHELRETVKDVRNSITWSDTCNERHEDIDRRLDRLETIMNGRLTR